MDFTQQVRQKREQQAEDFRLIAQNARIVAAIKEQTGVIKEQNQKLDTIIGLLKTDQTEDDKEAKTDNAKTD